jgi:hypothetical protein
VSAYFFAQRELIRMQQEHFADTYGGATNSILGFFQRRARKQYGARFTSNQ